LDKTDQNIYIADKQMPKLKASENFLKFPDIEGEPENEYFFRRMYLIRYFEETLLRLFEENRLYGTTHCCIGQEANAVGIISNLKPDDHVFSNHRCHGHYLMHTKDIIGLLAEIMGLPQGTCAGIGGSQHLCSDFFKSNGIQGGIVPAAVGIGFSYKLKKSKQISAVFIGDGTLGQGIVYESLNMASLWDIPVLFVVENNFWAQSSPSHSTFAGSIKDRFSSFNIQTDHVDTTDVCTVSKKAREAVAYVRKKRKPFALIIDTYRLCHHSKNDDFRPSSEIAQRKTLDPLIVHGKRLGKSIQKRIKNEVEQCINSAVDYLKAIS
jgi:acetoin:2,6-dichlorophenolindophenol oxidoreductase subunit alpha